MANIEKRTSLKGETTFRAKVRLKGFPAQTATFERLTDARKWAQQTEAAIREGRHFKTIESKRHTLAEMIDRYIRDVIPYKPKNLSNRLLHLNWWKQNIGERTLADVTPALIGECRDILSKEYTNRGKLRSSGTVVRYMAALSHVYTVAVKEWGWVDDTPMRKVTKPKESRGRIRFLSDDERERLLLACKQSDNAYLYTIVVLAISTGMRHGEIMNLTWSCIDLKNSRLVLHETKNNERRSVAIAGHAHECLHAMSKIRQLDTNYLFPSDKKQNDGTRKPFDIRKPWERAIKEAQIADFVFHDLRHSCASYLAMNGATLAEIAEVLGHKTLQMVKRYAHLSDGHVSKIVTAMNQKIFT